MRRALLLGASGQDGSWLADLLSQAGYNVFGVVRPQSTHATWRIDHLVDAGKITLIPGDVLDGARMARIVADVRPDEVYQLAAQSHVGISFPDPVTAFNIASTGVLNVLEACRMLPDVRIYVAASSELFGQEPAPQSLATPFRPVSPYACGKLAAFHLARTYRKAYGMYVSTGVLFNHCSARRGIEFVTRKAARQVAEIKCGRRQRLSLGNLDAIRDIGHAPEFCAAMHLMLQQPEPGEYLLATGEGVTIRQFVQWLLDAAGIRQTVDDLLDVDPAMMRPSEVPELRGDWVESGERLGWRPQYRAADVAQAMYEAELLRVANCEPILY